MPAVAGSTDYSWEFTVGLPGAETYQIVVRYESDAGDVRSEARTLGRVKVVPSMRVTVTSPSGRTTWRRGASKTVRWRVSEAVPAGAFHVWAVSARGIRYRVTAASAPVVATAGTTSYSARWKVNAPSGKGYRVLVEYWWGGARVAAGKSAGLLTITR